MDGGDCRHTGGKRADCKLICPICMHKPWSFFPDRALKIPDLRAIQISESLIRSDIDSQASPVVKHYFSNIVA